MTLSVADLKAHLNITTDADDALLQDKIDAAEGWIAAYCGEPFTDAPAPVQEATRQLAAHLYENREASLIGVSAQQLPFGTLDLLAPYRAWAF
jgi:uncharacterized phage protein (predicted DNA packaging)